jgi:hypothetical protein
VTPERLAELKRTRMFYAADASGDIAIICELLAHIATLEQPDMFWEIECDGDNAVDDPAQIADNLDIGTVFALSCAKKLPEAFYVAEADDQGRSVAWPATPAQIETFKKQRKEAQDRRRAEWAAKNATVQPVKAVPLAAKDAHAGE